MLGDKKQRALRTASDNKVVQENLGLIGLVINRYFSGYVNNPTFNKEDMYQEGVLGLMHAMETYTPGKAKFSTHAVTWIKQYITYGLRQSGFQGVRLPSYIHYLRPGKDEDEGPKIGEAAQIGLDLLDRINTALVHLDADEEGNNSAKEGLACSADELKAFIDNEEYEFLVECVKTELRDICANRKHSKRDYLLFLDRFGMNETHTWHSYTKLAKKYRVSAMMANNIVYFIILKLRKRVPQHYLRKRARVQGE